MRWHGEELFNDLNLTIMEWRRSLRLKLASLGDNTVQFLGAAVVVYAILFLILTTNATNT